MDDITFILNYIDKMENKNKKFKTNYSSLDKLLKGGFNKGTLNEITGDYFTGKSTLCMNILKNIDENISALYIVTNNNNNTMLLQEFSNKDNITIIISNKESVITSLLNRTINYFDLIIIDSIADVLSISEEEHELCMNYKQNLKPLIRQLYELAYGTDKVIIAVNSLIYLNNILTSKYNEVMKIYCSSRILMDRNYQIIIIKEQ